MKQKQQQQQKICGKQILTANLYSLFFFVCIIFMLCGSDAAKSTERTADRILFINSHLFLCSIGGKTKKKQSAAARLPRLPNSQQKKNERENTIISGAHSKHKPIHSLLLLYIRSCKMTADKWKHQAASRRKATPHAVTSATEPCLTIFYVVSFAARIHTAAGIFRLVSSPIKTFFSTKMVNDRMPDDGFVCRLAFQVLSSACQAEKPLAEATNKRASETKPRMGAMECGYEWRCSKDREQMLSAY